MSQYLNAKTIGSLIAATGIGVGAYMFSPAPAPDAQPPRVFYEPRPADQRHWGGLRPEEIKKLHDSLREISPAKVMIYCGGNYCRDLAEDLDETFESAGFDSYIELPLLDLGKGVGAAPATNQVNAVAAAIKKATDGRIDLPVFDPASQDGKKIDYQGAIVIALGRKAAR